MCIYIYRWYIHTYIHTYIRTPSRLCKTCMQTNNWRQSIPILRKKWTMNEYICKQKECYSLSGVKCRSQWPRGLRRRSAAACLLRLWVWILPGAWTFVCCECSVLSGRGLCDELSARPEESYRLWYVFVCDLESSWMMRPGCKLRYLRFDVRVFRAVMRWRLVNSYRCFAGSWCLHFQDK